jgi:hypothetical protein
MLSATKGNKNTWKANRRILSVCISTLCGVLRMNILAMAKVCNKIETCKDFGENLSEKVQARNEKE